MIGFLNRSKISREQLIGAERPPNAPVSGYVLFNPFPADTLHGGESSFRTFKKNAEPLISENALSRAESPIHSPMLRSRNKTRSFTPASVVRQFTPSTHKPEDGDSTSQPLVTPPNSVATPSMASGGRCSPITFFPDEGNAKFRQLHRSRPPRPLPSRARPNPHPDRRQVRVVAAAIPHTHERPQLARKRALSGRRAPHDPLAPQGHHPTASPRRGPARGARLPLPP